MPNLRPSFRLITVAFLIAVTAMATLGNFAESRTFFDSVREFLGIAPTQQQPAAQEPPTGTTAPSFAVGTCDGPNAIDVEASAGTTFGNYTTLKGAFDKINDGTHQGAITIEVCGNTTEGSSAVINASGAGLASYSTILITPVGGAARSISGAFLGALIDLNGADNVTINGLNSGGNSLEIDNQNTAASFAIRFIGDASNNIIQNSTIRGANSLTATAGTIVFGTGTTTGNDGNLITNNSITTSSGGNPQNAIYSAGTSAAIDNSGNTLNANNISDYFNAANATNGILLSTGNSGWTITNNRLFQTATRVFTGANTHSAINVQSGSGYSITGNTIGFANSAGTGTTNIIGLTSGALGGTFPTSYTTGGTANATRFIAMNLAFTVGGTVSEIQNNTIGGFALYTSSGATTTNGIWCGINVTSGNANIGTTTGNTIGATSGQGSIYTAATTGGAAAVGIYATSTNTVTIQNNSIGAIDSVGTTSTLSGAFTGIDTAGTGGVFNISSNTIGNTTADNIRTGYTLSSGSLSNAGTLTSTTGTTSPMVGVRNSATGSLIINSNTLRGWVNGSTGGGALTGITSTGANATSVTINSNALGTSGLGWMRWAFANTGGTVTGINLSGATTATSHSIQTNDFRGLVYSVSGTSSHTYINKTAGTAANDISTIASNTFTNLNVNTTGSVTFISQSYNAASTGTKNTNSNSIVTAFAKTAAGGTVTFITDNGSSVSGAVSNCQNNNFSNGTLTGLTAITGISYTDGGTAPTRTVTGNTMSNWTTGGSAVNMMNFTYWNGTSSLSNNTISNIAGQSTVTGITLGSTVSTATSVTVNGNSITGLSSTGTGGTVTGITNSNTSTAINITSNVINNLSTTATSVVGIVNSGSTAVNINSNTINTLSTTGASGVANGITATAGTSIGINKNKIYDLQGNQVGSIVNGLNLTSGTTFNISNNLIGDLRTPAGTSLDAIRGINASATSTYNVYHNTIYLNATSIGATFGNSCITFSSTATTLNLRNNILVNLSTPGTEASNLASNGIVATLRRSTGTAATVPVNYNTASNNNDFWVNPTAGTNNHTTYVEGTSTITNSLNTFAQMKTFMGNRDQASFAENPTFLSTTGSNANFLHINTTVVTQIESGGGPGTGIADDVDGDVRNISTPDIGADEFSGIGIDLSGPSISYTNLTNTSCANDVTLTATITDGTGVNITAGTRPRLYFKKATNSTAFNDNTNATDGWKFVEATGVGGSPFSFTTNFALLFGGVPVTGDTIQYFVVAQDTAGTPNISINTGTFAAAPTSVALTSAAFPIGGTINSYNLITPGLSGTVTIGAAGTYPNLTGATGLFNAINTSGLSGALTVNIIDTAVAETGATALNAINYNGCSAGPYAVLIKPNTTATLTGSFASGLISLNAADNVTIDGSNNGSSSRDLTITNTNTGTSSAVVWLQSNGANGATNNTIKNVNIVGNSNTTTLFGIGSGSSTVATTSLGNGNNSNTVENNNISKTQYGIYSQGASAGSKNTGNSITKNLINSVAPNNVARGGIWAGFENAITVSGNTVSEMSLSGSPDTFGISLGFGTTMSATTSLGNEVTNATVSNNIVGTVINSGTFSAYGIGLASATSGTSTLSNNVVYGVAANGTSGDFGAGIVLGGGAGSVTNVYHNSVSMQGTVTGASAGTQTNAALAVTASSAPTLNIRNNVFSNTQIGNTGSTARFVAVGLGYSSTVGNYAGLTSNNNDLYVTPSGSPYFIGTRSTIVAGTTLLDLTAWSAETGRDNSTAPEPVATRSISSPPLFNSLIDLRPQLGSPLVGAGVAGTGVTTDLLAVVRSTGIAPAGPSIGAYENAVDVAPPAISYSALGNTISTANRALNAVTVTDASGVNGTAGTRPRVYYKKSTDANAFVGNTAGDNGWKFVEATGSASPFDFTIDYSIINGGAVVASDTIQYFVVAQDTASTPNVGINSGTFAAAPASVALGAAQAPIGGSINSYAIAAAVNGTFYVGTGSTCGPSGTDPCTFTSLTNAGGVFQYINSNVVTGNIIIELANDLSGETGTFGLLPFASPYTLTIYPTGTGPRTIAGTGTNSAVVPIIGADRVTIDGSIGGTGTSRDLIISNSNTTSGSGVVFIGSQGTGAGATNITIRNTVIRAGSIGNTTTFTFGVFIGDQTGASAGADNDNITLHNNKIMKARTAIQATGVATTGVMDSLAVTNNTIGDSVAADTIGRIGVSLSNSDAANISGNTISNLFLALDNQSATGISFSGASNTTVSQNTITNIKSTGASTTPTGIATSSSTGSTITRNTINDIAGSNSTNPSGITLGTGAITSTVARNTISNIAYTGTAGYAGRGITVNTGNAASALTISNNFISDIRGDSWNGIGVDHIAGILLLGTSGGIDLHHNSVNLGSGTFAGNSSGTLSTALGIASGVTALDVRGNIFANNLVNSNAAAAKAYAIYSAAPASIFSATSDRNDYYASGTQGVLGFLGGDQSTIGAWQTAVGSTVDDNSIALDPQFTSATDLHIQRAPAAYNLSPVENAGVPVAGISTDADGDTRDASTPDIGADEVISVQLSSATYSVAENVGGGVATVTVTRTAGAATAASVSYSTADDTAINGGTCTGSTDYISAAGTLNFAIGETSKTFDITICNNALFENDDALLVALSSPSGVILGGPALGTVTITNDDTAPTVSINDVEFPADSVVDTKFTVNLSAASGISTTVPYSSGGGTATGGTGCAAGDDYESVSGTLTFPAGITSQEIPISICPDTVQEPTETFNLTLGTPTGATILDGLGVGTISSADSATASVSNGSLSEGNMGTSNMSFAVNLTTTSSTNTTINYTLTNGTATSGSDFDGTAGSITINAGDTTGTILVSINGDTIYEADETFSVSITSTDVGIGTGTATGTINNDDAPPSTVVVNTTADTDDGFCLAIGEGNGCTLREAINAANANPDATTINFGIPGAGVQTIQPGSPLPSASTQVFIDGYSQPLSSPNTDPTTAGINAVPLIELSGVSAGAAADGLRLAGGGSTVRGLIINRFSDDGISIVANSDSNTIQGNFIGTDATGTVDLGNSGDGISSDVVLVSAVPDLTLIGGTNVADRNLISGNNGDGIDLFFANTTTIQGNIIGLQRNGVDLLGNNGNGINASVGEAEIIGGTDAAERNIISGNGNGISINDNATIQGNYIGTDVSGTLDRGNIATGISANVSLNNQIGGTSVGAGNLISGNGQEGIRIGNSSGNVIQGNFIGTQADGTSPLGNGDIGVSVFAGTSSNNIIGGIASGAGNTIAFNGGDGIEIAIGAGNRVSRNSIHSNGTTSIHLGIDLIGTDGVNTNDSGDGDSGPNNLQNYPVITAAEVTGSTKHIFGTLNSTPSMTFVIDVYGNTACDGTGYGEGQTYIGTFNVTTDASGDASFDVTSLNPIVGSFLTATATDPSGNTSEFSACQQVVSGSAGTIQFSSPTYTVGEGGGTVSFTVNRSGGTDGSVSATLSASDGTAVAPGDYLAFASTTVAFADGDNTPQTFNITINEDSNYETGETINLALSSTTINLTGETATVTITDNDTAPVINSNNVTLAEGSGGGLTSFTFDLTKVGNTEVNATVNWAAVVGTASASDFSVVSATPITFLPSETTKQVTVVIVRDDIYEIDETFTLDISGGTNATAGTDGSGTISNDDAVPTISVNDVEFVGQSVVDTKFTVTLTGSSEVTATVNYDTNGITATRGASCTGSADFVRSNGTLTFLGGETSKVVTITICPDSIVEPTETFSIDLSTPGHSTISDAQGIGTISSDDASSASVAGVSANETNSGTTTFSFPVTLTNPVSTNVTINYTLANGTATAGSDFDGTAGSITINAGDTTGTILVSINGDTIYEADETFSVSITSTDVGIGTGTATGTITNDDAPPSTVVVNTTADTDDGFCLAIGEGNGCTLREAINAANANPDATTINFGIPGVGPFTIMPLSALPNIDQPTVIAGESQPGFASIPVVEISGISAPDGVTGIIVNGDNSTIRYLAINNFLPGLGVGLAPVSNVVIENNFIGTDVTGTVAASNSEGINANFAVNTTLSGNVISGNTNTAIGGGWNGGLISNNRIGTDRFGTSPIPNGDDGLFITGISLSILDNVISGNLSTGLILGPSSTNSIIRGNFIGTDALGTAIIGNGDRGVEIGGTGNIIGGSGVGHPNIIANNSGNGLIVMPGALNNSVRANSIRANSALGIDLGNDGVTPNDSGDGDSGPNNLQNYPVITAAEVTGSTKHIVGTLNSTPSMTFAIDVYGNTACDGSGYGEGQTYIGTFNVTTDASGDASFDVTSLNPIVGSFLTATATDPSGNTSEFSACQQVVSGSAGTIEFATTTYNVNEGDGTATITFVRTGGSDGSISATFSTNDGTASAPGDYTAVTGQVVTFGDGDTVPKTKTVTIIDDGADEPTESVDLELTSTTINGVPTGLAATLFIVDNDEPAAFTINATAGANGTISPSGAVGVASGGNQTFFITADTGWNIIDVNVDGSSVGAVSSYTFSNVLAPHTISATFGIIGLEGDVAGCPSATCPTAPAPNAGYPNGSINSGDLTRVRNLVAGRTPPNSMINEFQRADVAPFVGRGDGRLTSGDVTVLRRYISGDLMTVRVPASGPVSAIPFVDLPLDPTGQRDETERETPFRVIGGTAAHGENVTIAVELDQRGVENSYSYTLNFDPTRLNLATGGVRLDGMTMLGGGALTVNYDDAANGNIGILFDLPAGQVITSGATRHTVLLTFYVPKRAPLGDAYITFSDSVAEQYLSNATGDPIAFKFVPGVVSVVATSR